GCFAEQSQRNDDEKNIHERGPKENDREDTARIFAKLLHKPGKRGIIGFETAQLMAAESEEGGLQAGERAEQTTNPATITSRRATSNGVIVSSQAIAHFFALPKLCLQ